MACVSQCSWMVGQEINSSVMLLYLQACKAQTEWCSFLLASSRRAILPGHPSSDQKDLGLKAWGIWGLIYVCVCLHLTQLAPYSVG